MFATTNKLFSGKLKAISAATGKMQDLVQDALIDAVYLTIKDHNCAPFTQLLEAVGTAAHRQGIVRWAETFAPVMIRDESFKLNATAYKEMDKDAILADFDGFIAESGMADVKWYEIAKKENTVVSIWNAGDALDRYCKKLEDGGVSELARMLRATYDAYVAKAALAPAA
jgi:hypothetical protein